jgi:hypothetical protein
MSKGNNWRLRDYVADVRKNPVSVLKLFFCLLSPLLLISTPTSAEASASQLDPVSLSFPTPQLGYVLSLKDCAAKTCASLQVTRDAGTLWGIVPVPNQLNKALQLAAWGTYPTQYQTLTVHFADATNGWIYGTVPVPVSPTTDNPNGVGRLWSTHDGGKVWSEVHLGPFARDGAVLQMATHGKWTYLFGASFQTGRAYLLSSLSNMDQWTNRSKARVEVPAGGTQLEGAFTFAGSSGWFVAGNDRGFTGSARLLGKGSWGAWSGPSIGGGSSSFTPILAVTSRVLVVNGEDAGFVTPPATSVPPGWNSGAPWLFISKNSGATFEPLRKLSNTYEGNYSTMPGLSAAPVPGTILLSSNSDDHLVKSTNWGRTWRTVLDHPVSQIIFTGRTDGFALVEEGSSQMAHSVVRTVDEGNHWEKVSI